MTGYIRQYSIVMSLVVFGAFFLASAADAAVVSMRPQITDVALQQTFTADIILDSEEEYINVVQAEITYPRELLQVETIDWGGSFLTMWVQEPVDHPETGTISLIGGKPNGTRVIDSPVVRITFRPTALGTATISINADQSQVLLNDGVGTAAPLTAIDATVTIINQSPYNLDIDSPTHPEQDQWYSEDTFIAEWDARPNAYYSHTLSNSPTTAPDEFVDEPAGSATYEELADGVHYFTVSETLPNDEWAVVGQRRVKVDTTEPLPISVAISDDGGLYQGKYYLSFGTYDATSGIDYYEIVEGNQVVSPAASPYLLTDQAHAQTIVVRAFDRAGNRQETRIARADVSADSLIGMDTNVLLLVGIVALAIAAVLGIYIMRQRKERV